MKWTITVLLLAVPAISFADCQEYKVVDLGDRVDVVCEGTVSEADKATISNALAPMNREAKAFAEKYMEYATEKQRMDLENSKIELEKANAKAREYAPYPPGYFSGRTFQPEEVKKGSFVDINGRPIDGAK